MVQKYFEPSNSTVTASATVQCQHVPASAQCVWTPQYRHLCWYTQPSNQTINLSISIRELNLSANLSQTFFQNLLPEPSDPAADKRVLSQLCNPTAGPRFPGSQGCSVPVPFRFLGSANQRCHSQIQRWKQRVSAIGNLFGSLKCKTCEEHAVAAVRFALQLLRA